MTGAPTVAFDLNALCNVILGREGFSGISRVIHDLGVALVQQCEDAGFDICFGMAAYPQFIPEMERYFAGRGVDVRFAQPSAAARRFYRLFVDNKLYPYQGQFLGKCMPPIYGPGVDPALIHSPYWHVRRHKRSGAPLVVTVHDLIALQHPEYFDAHKGKRARRHIEAVASEADHFICVSENTRQDLCRHYPIPVDRTSVVPLAASGELFYRETGAGRLAAVRERYAIPDGPYLLSLATIEPRKNFVGVIEAFTRYLEKSGDRDLTLVVAGAPGWMLEQALGAGLSSPALAGRVVRTGFVADEDIAALYSGAEAFLYLSHYEGFGLPPLEAMQCGTPVICSDTSSLPEVVGDAGLLVDPTQPEAACEALSRVLDEPGRAEAMARAGMERSRTFSWDNAARGTLKVYSDMLR